MAEHELEMVAGGAGYCYWMKDGEKYNYVMADRPLSREEVLKVWFHEGMMPVTLDPRTDENGNVLPQTNNVWRGKGLKAEYLDEFLRRNNERFDSQCQYIEFK